MKKLLFLLITFTLLSISCATPQQTIPAIPTSQIELIIQEKKQIIVDNSLDSGLENLTNQIIKSLSQESKSRIAVVEFSDLNGNITELGMYLSEELITRLFLTHKFYVIERQLLNMILSEQKLTLTGLVDQNSAKQLGQILGVDAIVSGTITDLGKSIKVNARVISTETGSVFAVAAAEIKKDETVRNLMSQVGVVQKPKEKETEKVKERPVEKKVIKEVKVFFKEDFSTVEEGNFPMKWIGGESLIVSSDGRQKFITPFEGQNHNFSVVNIDFPENFKFEWILQTAPPGWWAHTAIIGDVKIKFDSNGNRVQMNNTEKRIDNVAGKTIKISLEKYDSVFKLYIDGKQIIIARYPRYKSPKGFSFEFKFPQFKLYKIVGMSL